MLSLSKVITSVLFANFCLLTFVAHAQTTSLDPCSFIEKKWSGGWYRSTDECKWDATIRSISHYGDHVQLEIALTNGLPGCNGGNFILSGTCREGALNFNYEHDLLTGMVTNQVMTLNNIYISATFWNIAK